MGSSLMNNSFSVMTHNNSITVKQVDVRHLLHGILHLREDDYVVLKVDIEGAEFDLLRRIISRGLLHLIDVLAVEWHDENGLVFGYNSALVDHYRIQHRCINWIVEDTPIRNIPWH